EEVVRVVEPALSLGREVDTELVGDVTERALEVRRELARVPSRGATPDPVALEEQHPLRRTPQREEGCRDPGDAGTHHHDGAAHICVEWPGWGVGSELGDPRRPARLVLVRRAT